LIEITHANIAQVYGFVNHKLIRRNLSMGYGMGKAATHVDPLTKEE